jgi:hypothetical protein
MCKCTHTSSDHEKLQTLLEDEKKSREVLVTRIDEMLACKGSYTETIFTEVSEQVLLAVKDYLLGMQILTDGMRSQFMPLNTVHDTEPNHMGFENPTPKAPETLRCIAPKDDKES